MSSLRLSLDSRQSPTCNKIWINVIIVIIIVLSLGSSLLRPNTLWHRRCSMLTFPLYLFLITNIKAVFRWTDMALIGKKSWHFPAKSTAVSMLTEEYIVWSGAFELSAKRRGCIALGVLRETTQIVSRCIEPHGFMCWWKWFSWNLTEKCNYSFSFN